MTPLEDLKERIAKGKVLAIVGAGVSIGTSKGHPQASWKGLLEHGIEHCESFCGLRPGSAQRHRDELAEGDTISWLGVASQVHERMLSAASGEFHAWLEETIGSIPLKDPSVLEALRDLPITLATTNYDSLLEEATGRAPVTWRETARMQRVLQGDEEGILHLHGHYKDPKSVILGYRSYQEVVGDTAAQAIQQLLFGTRTLLYVGFGASFEDPNFSNWLRWEEQTFQGRRSYRHYRLCLDSEVEAVQAQHPRDQRIFALPYGETHGRLAPFLLSLAPEKESKKPDAPDEKNEREASSTPPLPALPPAPWLFGRDEVLTELVNHLCAENPAPVPILGGPGMGKTALSVWAFRHPAVEAHFDQRRYFVPCDSVSTADALPAAIAMTMGLPSGGDPRRSLLEHLDSQPTLLVLDNLGTPWDEDRRSVEALLAGLANQDGVALVVSLRGSRRPRGVPWRSSMEISKLPPDAARQLFLESAGGNHLIDPDLAELLDILDGVPLALKLLGSVAETAPNIQWVLDAWKEERASLFQQGEAKDDDFLLSVSFSLQHSKVDANAQKLAAALGRLPSGVALGDIEALDADFGRQAAQQLRGAGLVSYEDGRLRTLGPVRAALQALLPLDEDRERRIVLFYLRETRTHGNEIGLPESQNALGRLLPELPNLEWALRRGLEGVALEEAFAALQGYTLFLEYRGIGSPNILAQAAETARQLERPRDQANSLLGLGDVYLTRSHHEEARRSFLAAKDLFRALPDPNREADCLQRLGDLAKRRSDYENAHLYLEAALPLYKASENLIGEANCTKLLGDIDLIQWEHETARQHFEAAMALYQQKGSSLGEANCLRSLGSIDYLHFDYPAAIKKYEAALQVYRELGDRLGEANCTRGLGDIDRRCRRVDSAWSKYDSAKRFFHDVCDVLGEASCERRFGDIELHRANHQAARSHFRAAMPLFQKIGDLLGEANCLRGLGDIERDTDSPDQARSFWRRALEKYQKIPDPYSSGRIHRRMARLALGQEDRKQHLEAAREVWKIVGIPELLARLDREFQ